MANFYIGKYERPIWVNTIISLIVFILFAFTIGFVSEMTYSIPGTEFWNYPISIFMLVYYECLIWSKAAANLENVLFLPVLLKFRLIRNFQDSKRSVLFNSMMPILITTIICPIMCSVLNSIEDIQGYSISILLQYILLSMPLICMIRGLRILLKDLWINYK